MKRHILSFVRSAGLLRRADRVMLIRGRLSASWSNRGFARANPDFATPPEDLSFDAYNHVNWTKYRDTGRQHAQVYARLIAESTGGASASNSRMGLRSGADYPPYARLPA